MKQFLLFVLLSAITVGADAQFTAEPKTPFNGTFTAQRITADHAEYHQFDATGKDVTDFTGNVYDIKRSADGLTDTINISGGLAVKIVNRYTEKGFLTSFNELVSGASATYAYDSIGRIKSIQYSEGTGNSVVTVYDYSNNTITTTQKNGSSEIFTVDSIQYTDSGYVVTRGTERTEYVFDAQKRLVRCGSTTYSYTTDGYEMIDSTSKTDFHFREDGCLNEKDKFAKNSIGEWVLAMSTKYSYKSTPMAVDNIKPTLARLYSQNGSLFVELTKPTTVHIYSVSGRLVNQFVSASGIHSVFLSSGIYFVRLGNETRKIAVK